MRGATALHEIRATASIGVTEWLIGESLQPNKNQSHWIVKNPFLTPQKLNTDLLALPLWPIT